MRKYFITSVFLLFSATYLLSQDQDCGGSQARCDLNAIDGFQGTNAAATGAAGGAVCPSNGGGQIHNAVWFGFIAGNTSIDIEYELMNCMSGTNGCNGDGVQIAVWEGCEAGGGRCVGGSGNCIDPTTDPIGVIPLTGLIPGLVYNFVLDGCCGATCAFELNVNVGPWDFDIPDLDNITLEANVDNRGSSAIDPDNFIYCPGQEVIFTASGDNGIVNVDNVQGLWEWSVNGPGPAEWSTSNGDGGSDFNIQYGDVDLDNNPGSNIVTMIFNTEGTYDICLDGYSTLCDDNDSGGPVCQTITITEIEPQEFGEFDLCRVNFVDNRDRFFPPDFVDANGVAFEWDEGNPIVFDDVPTPDGGVLTSSFVFGRGPCEVEQTITINIVGDNSVQDEIVALYDCQIPYDLEVLGMIITIDDIDAFSGEQILLDDVGPEENFEGDLCPAQVNIIAERIELLDSVRVDCQPNGLSVTGVIFREDNELFEFNPDLWVWRDSVDVSMGIDNVIATTNPAILPEGTYILEYTGDVLDAFTNEFFPCSGVSNPLQVVATGQTAAPVAMPYDENRCPDELNNIQVGVNMEPGATYMWNVPAGYQANSGLTSNTLNVTILDPNATGLLNLVVSGGCSPVTVEFPFTISDLPIVDVTGPTDECAGTEAIFQFNGNQADIASYAWDFGTATVTSGSLTGPMVGITFPPGAQSFNYTLTLTNQAGCTDSESFTITINESLENPQVTCDLANTSSTQIVFTWPDVTGNTGYTVDDINLPAGATGVLNGTTYTVTGVAAGDIAQIQVNVQGSPCGVPSAMMTCNASSCSPPAPMIGNFSQLDICQGDPTNTTIQFTAQAPAGFTGTYSGNGVTPTGLFDPADPAVVLGTNTITFSYVDDADPNCSTSITADVNVDQAPTPDFTINVTDVCEGEEFTITGPDATSNPVWDFGGGVGDENGLTFNTSGPQVIAVTVTSANACSAVFSVDIDVEPILEDINVTCVGTTTDVTFTWNEISNADRYELVYTAPDGMMTNSSLDVNVTSFTTPLLNENDVVSLMVTAVNNNANCNSVSDVASCMAIACNVPVVELSSATGQIEFCTNDLLSPVNLVVMVDGADPEPGTLQFSGTGVSQVGDNGVFDPNQAPGVTTVFLDYTDPITGCPGSTTLEFEVLIVERPTLTPDRDVICLGETVIIDHDGMPAQGTDAWVIPAGASVDILTDDTRELSWDVPGSYRVTHTYMNGNCTPETAEVIIEVVLSAETPIVICESTGTDFIRFGWSDQTQFMFEVFIDGASEGIQSESEFTVMNLTEGDEVEIVVVVIDPNCGDMTSDPMTCFASTCSVVWNVTSVPDMVCRADGNPAIELEVSAFDPFDPSVIIDAEWLNPEVNGNLFTPPAGNGTFTLMARYTNGTCVRDTNFMVEIFEVPEFALTVSPDPICVNETAVLSYDYTLVGNEQLIWDFGVGAEGAAGVGTQEVSFDADDLYTISLIIDNNGCPSEEVTVDLEVQAELIEPDIRCGTATITTVDIEWDEVFCADMYNVSVDGALVATVPQASYTVENLTSEQTVDITIEAVSSCACGNISFSMTCTTEPCPDEVFTFSGFTAGAPICIEDNASSLTVVATPTTLLGTGTGTWTPTAFLDADGNINPELATAGTFEIEYNYSEDVCNYTTSTMITFVDAPTINILSVTDPACPDDTQGSISVEGLNGQAPYMFSIDGGPLQADGTFNNVNIGDHTLQVVDDNGCIFDGGIATVSNPITPTIRVSGDNSIILGETGFYELDLGSINQSQISDILWLNNGVPVCNNLTCLTYTFSNAEVDAEIQVIVTYNGGCEVASNVFRADVVRIQDFYVPNVISPDGAINPVDQQWSLFIEGDEVFPRSINVYNRWGNLVHSEEWAFDENNLPPNDGQGLLLWDGFYGESGPPIVAGVYAYILQIEVSGVLRNIGGDLTIIR